MCLGHEIKVDLRDQKTYWSHAELPADCICILYWLSLKQTQYKKYTFSYILYPNFRDKICTYASTYIVIITQYVEQKSNEHQKDMGNTFTALK